MDGRTNYSSRLEEDPFPSGGGPTADYAFMLFFGAAVLWVRIQFCPPSAAPPSLPSLMCSCPLQVIGFLMEIPFLGTSLIFMILYVWSRRNPTQPVAIWGEQPPIHHSLPGLLLLTPTYFLLAAGFSFEGLYLPWALIAFTVLIGGSPMMDFLGVVAGHLYYFLLEVLPATKGWTLLQTPAILYVPLPSIDARRPTQLLTRILAVTLSVRLFPSPQTFGATPIIGARGPAAAAQQGGGGYAWGTGRPLGAL